MPLISGLLAACPQRNTAGAMLFLQEPIYQLTRPAAKTPTVIAGVVDTSALLDNNTPLRPSDCSPSKGSRFPRSQRLLQRDCQSIGKAAALRSPSPPGRGSGGGVYHPTSLIQPLRCL